MQKVVSYFRLLFQTYKMFFKATLLVALTVVILTPLEALAPVLAVRAGQQLVDLLNEQRPYMYFFVL
ncbi:hypothetical protein [Ligilactobacillus murinus]|uniref:hypothetical protein n=1 Tax=Ligilactobacillus murinus TaxID=1622 RepID=UPI000EBB8AE2|nr:hypothetical protein [Ligilactobacillus murinus]HCM79449.1 hypothetical protein [Lactobacillus sp.]